jgi:anti-sigma regulatory factor (Ser/Thr protein kinase)
MAPVVHAYERRVPATTQHLAALRQTLRDWLEAAVDDPRRRTDIVLAASELATAMMRAASSDLSAIALRAWVDHNSVVVESRALAGADATTSASSRAFNGSDGERGFSIVASLSDVVAVRDATEGVVVRAQMPGPRLSDAQSG